MNPGPSTVGRFWADERTGELWLQEHADKVNVSFLPGHFKAVLGERFVHPERKLIVAGDTEHGLRLLDEPIAKTLQREREEGTWSPPLRDRHGLPA